MTTNSENVTTINPGPDFDEQVRNLLTRRAQADRSANVSALSYMADFDAQEAKLRTRYVKVVEKALAAGDVDKLRTLCAQAEKEGIKL